MKTRAALLVCVLAGSMACSGAITEPPPDAGTGPRLSWSPERVDCGYTVPGLASRHVIAFRNDGDVPVHLTHFDTQSVLGVRILDVEGRGLSELTVPALGVASVTVEFLPPALGPMQLDFSFRTDIPGMPTGTIALRCFGGGPDVDVEPSPVLDFGRVANTPGTFQTRRLRVMNLGASAQEGDLEGNLKVTAVEVHPTGDTLADEIQVALPDTYDPEVGLEPWSGRNVLDVEVKVTPIAGEGMRGANVVIKTNDPDEPEVLIEVRAEVVALPPCQYWVDPEFVNYSGLRAPDFRDVPVTISNAGTNPCMVSTFRVGGSGSLSLSLSNAPDSVEIPPGKTHQFFVHVEGPEETPASGHVFFFASNPEFPEYVFEVKAQ